MEQKNNEAPWLKDKYFRFLKNIDKIEKLWGERQSSVNPKKLRLFSRSFYLEILFEIAQQNNKYSGANAVPE